MPNREPAVDRAIARALAIAAIAYLAFVVYGSLVPLNWEPKPLDEAWRAFWTVRELRFGEGDRADWVANILLMVPFAFLLGGALDTRGATRGLRLAAVVVFSVGMSAAIEFLQLFFPPRRSAIDDVVAQTIGAITGTVLWVCVGRRLCRGIAAWAKATHLEGRGPYLFYGYLLALTIYNLLPFDLGLSLSDLYVKWRSHRVILVPFSFAYASMTERLLDLALDIVAWIPVGLLARNARAGNSARVLLYCAAFAALLEFLQLFVHSRLSDITDVLLATLGCAVGIFLARVVGRATDRREGPPAPSDRPSIGLAWLWAAAYAVVILAALWFPYDFRFDPAFARERYAALWAVPLEKLYFQTEFRAASTVVLKAGLFVPLGLLLSMGISRVSPEGRSLAAWGAAISVVLLALVGELGQVFLPGKYPDLSDVILACGGAFLAALLVLGPGDLARALTIPRRAPPPRVALAIVYVAVLALIWIVTHWPGAPYNVRELLRPGTPLLSAALLAAAIVWLCAFPTLAAWSIRGRDATRAMVRWPVVLVSHAALAYVLLALAVPEESIGDIVGSPVLDGPRQLEYLVRSTVLYATVVWLLFLGGLTAWRRKDYLGTHAQLTAVSMVVSVFLLPIAHWVIVVQAATDNLVELMRDGGGIAASTALACFLVLLGATGAWIARILQRGARLAPLRAIALAAVSALAGYGLLMLGTEQTLFKYDKVFSALQFLLSMDRNHYLSGPSLLVRFAVAYAGAIAMVVAYSWPVVRNVRRDKSYTGESSGHVSGRPDPRPSVLGT